MAGAELGFQVRSCLSYAGYQVAPQVTAAPEHVTELPAAAC